MEQVIKDFSLNFSFLVSRRIVSPSWFILSICRYFEQESSIVSLIVDTKYYLEVNLVNIGGIGHAAVGVKFPNGDTLAPITYDYLYSKYE